MQSDCLITFFISRGKSFVRNTLALFYYTQDDILTWDKPILLKPHHKEKVSFYKGFWEAGVEIIFPISKNLIIIILDQEYFFRAKRFT